MISSLFQQALLKNQQEQLSLKHSINQQEDEFLEKREAERRNRDQENQISDLELENEKRMIALSARKDELELVQEIQGKERDFELDSMTKKMERYQSIVQSGMWDLLALSLSQNPGDVHVVMNEINRQKETDRLAWMQAVELLLSNGALEGHELEETAKSMLQGMVSSMRQGSVGISGSTPVASLEGNNIKPEAHQDTPSGNTPDVMPSQFEEDDISSVDAMAIPSSDSNA
jgi:hypothetical protein